MNQFITDLTGSKTMRIALTAVFILLAVFLLVKSWDAAFGHDIGDPYNTITVEGVGKSAAVPDTARITFTVTESAAAVADAQKAATDKTNAALAAVKDQGVDDKDVKTVAYNVSPKYEYRQPCAPGVVCSTIISGTPRIVGYDVSQTIEVKLHDTAKAGIVLEKLGSLGVQNISGPDFVVDDDNGVKNEARAEAIADARAKAKELSKELGVHLGKVVSFYENGSNPMPMYDSYGKGGGMMSAQAAVAPTLPTGQNETSVTVSITYEIR